MKTLTSAESEEELPADEKEDEASDDDPEFAAVTCRQGFLGGQVSLGWLCDGHAMTLQLLCDGDCDQSAVAMRLLCDCSMIAL